MNLPPADLVVVRRTSRRIAVQIAAVFTLAVLALATLAGVLVVRTQHTAAEKMLGQAIADSDAVTDPPSGIYIYQQSGDGSVTTTAGLPGPGPLDPAAFAAVAAGGTAAAREVSRGGRDFLVTTGHREDMVVQAALDLSEQRSERDRLFVALAEASALGLLVAGMLGWFIAGRAIRPLAGALDRQRRFIADASHELRTPLTQVHTRAQLLRRGLAEGRDGAEMRADADALVRGTRQFGEIIDELLLSAQLRDQPLAVDRVDLATLARDAVDDAQPRAVESGIALEVVADAGPHVVDGSAVALRRVLNALVDNAFGHNHRGGYIRVDLARLGGGQVRCTVSDDGSGFDEARTEQLFARFGRGEPGDGRRYGLGLALVKEVVTAHDGTVTATSPAGGGAVFTVILPAADRR